MDHAFYKIHCHTTATTIKHSSSPQFTVISCYPYSTYKLSEIFQRDPTLFTKTSIKVISKFLIEIDAVPKKFRNIAILYLSNNVLKDLSGIEQFPLIEKLSLANNEVF